MPSIVIIEDEPSIAQSLEFVLQADGFITHCCGFGGDGIDYVKANCADLIILDVGLPDMSGFEVCKNVRTFSDVPILFLTARSAEIDRIVGLEIGADDYVVKPFSPREVSARVRAILKRTQVNAVPPPVSAPFTINTQLRHIQYHTQPLSLTKAEFLLLSVMINEPDHVFSREQLLNALGVSTEANYDRTIDTHIKSIRAKLRAIDPSHDPIKTVRGFGYGLNGSLS